MFLNSEDEIETDSPVGEFITELQSFYDDELTYRLKELEY
jgi:hypothetical protein